MRHLWATRANLDASAEILCHPRSRVPSSSKTLKNSSPYKSQADHRRPRATSIKPVDQVSAPEIRTENRTHYFVFLQIIYCVYGHPLRIEVRIHPYPGIPTSPAVCGDRQRHHQRKNRPQGTSAFRLRWQVVPFFARTLRQSVGATNSVPLVLITSRRGRNWNASRRIKSPA